MNCYIGLLVSRGGTSRQNSGRVEYRVPKPKSGPGSGRVVATRSNFISVPSIS